MTQKTCPLKLVLVKFSKVSSFAQPAVFIIVVMEIPLAAALLVAAALVECGAKIEKSIPEARSMAFTHLLTVSRATAPCGLRVDKNNLEVPFLISLVFLI